MNNNKSKIRNDGEYFYIVKKTLYFVPILIMDYSGQNYTGPTLYAIYGPLKCTT